jgi:3'(2'), 5'-bisphosphate nucleotidase
VTTPHDHRNAIEIASASGAALLELRRTEASALDSRELCARGDRQSHDLITRRLAEAYPDDPILSEEGKDDPARLGGRRVWIVDPLDGTREFGEAGRTDWAVHVALIVDQAPVVGAVALPALGITYGTLNPPSPEAVSSGRPRIVVSRTRPPALALELAWRLDAELVEMGSAGAKTMAIIRGEADIYVHAAGQYEWDSAAPVAVAAAAGLHVSRLDSSPLRYNQPNPWLPDQLVCRPELAERVLGILRSVH